MAALVPASGKASHGVISALICGISGQDSVFNMLEAIRFSARSLRLYNAELS